jgi:hypothetical protein
VSLKGWGTIYQWNWETDTWDVLYDIPRPESPYYSSRRTVMPWQVASEHDAPPLPGL